MSTEIVQAAFASNTPPVKVIVSLPAAAVSVPPVQVVCASGGSATTTPGGSVSDSDTDVACSNTVTLRRS